MDRKEISSRYTEADLIRLAKRVRNAKRSYLLLNPLQGKHLPVSPREALAMMKTLGNGASRERRGGLVIGFAETATAIGAMAAFCQGDDAFYLPTTRETIPGEHQWIEFLEEHSHAAEQKLCTDQFLSAAEAAGFLLLVDDEISTGKTLLNMVQKLRKAFPEISGMPVTVLSVINRLNAERLDLLERNGISVRYLLHPEEKDLDAYLRDIKVTEAEAPGIRMPGWTALSERFSDRISERVSFPLPDPRTGINAGSYRRACESFAEAVLNWLEGYGELGPRVLVLGTEECMIPALLTGDLLESRKPSLRVFCHATTRSPIGIHDGDRYPIRSGLRLPGFYERERETFLYNLEPYDTVLLVTDAAKGNRDLEGLFSSIFVSRGARRVLFAYGESHVQQL